MKTKITSYRRYCRNCGLTWFNITVDRRCPDCGFLKTELLGTAQRWAEDQVQKEEKEQEKKNV